MLGVEPFQVTNNVSAGPSVACIWLCERTENTFRSQVLCIEPLSWFVIISKDSEHWGLSSWDWTMQVKRQSCTICISGRQEVVKRVLLWDPSESDSIWTKSTIFDRVPEPHRWSPKRTVWRNLESAVPQESRNQMSVSSRKLPPASKTFRGCDDATHHW